MGARSGVCRRRSCDALIGVAWQTSPPFVYAHWLVTSMDYDLVDATPSRWSAWALALELILGVGAIGGGSALMIGPNGEIIPLPVVALAGSPFANYSFRARFYSRCSASPRSLRRSSGTRITRPCRSCI
jgi:hypothetical protein